ncbi:hypothetical protein [Cohnella panacarvi]|uniref:hypothetical protein n=1 Tax=Cohnella panacarvi TaxID=400776 RepID=UPI00047AC0A2|nr:hypothetical protein [Cohnella panacarvi]
MLPDLIDYEVLAETRRAELERHLEDTARRREHLLSSPARKPQRKSGRLLLALQRVLNLRS